MNVCCLQLLQAGVHVHIVLLREVCATSIFCTLSLSDRQNFAMHTSIPLCKAPCAVITDAVVAEVPLTDNSAAVPVKQ